MNFSDKLVKIFSSFFGLGYAPFFPGTFGSMGGLAVYFLVYKSTAANILVTVFILILGFLVCARAENVFNQHDPKYVVIDEVCGMLIGLLSLPFSLQNIIIGFFLFRLLDTLKPYPICIFQRMRGSLGIMGDDILAGIFTNLLLHLVAYF